MAGPASRISQIRGWRLGVTPYLLLAPAMLMLLAVSAYPIFAGVRASLHRYRYGRDRGFTGFDNYSRAFHDRFFWDALWVTAKFVLIAVVIETLLGLALAMLVNRELRLPSIVRVFLLLPMTIAPIVVGIIWRLMYASDIGVVNPIFDAFGLDPPNVLAHNESAFIGIVAVDVWEWTPLLFLILLAGLQSLPQEPFEAAKVDGARPLRVFFDHTLPLLRPVLLVAITLRAIDALGTFDQIFVLTKGGPGTSTQLIAYYGYNTAFLFSQYGIAAAMIISLLLVIFALAFIVIRLMRRTAGAMA